MLDKGDEAIIRNIVLTANAELAKAQAITADALAKRTEVMAEHEALERRTDLEARIHLHEVECPVAKKVEAAENRLTGGWRTLAAVAGLITGAIALIAVLLELYWKSGI